MLYVCVCVCRMPSLSEQLQEVRSRAEVCLYSGGRVVEVRAGVMAMANLSLPPCSKYRHIAAETMVIENSFGSNRKEVREKKCTYTTFPPGLPVPTKKDSHLLEVLAF